MRGAQRSSVAINRQEMTEGGRDHARNFERYDAVLEIYDGIHRVYNDVEIDWMQIHDAGSTIDDTELPHHITSKNDLDRLIGGTFKSFLNALPAPPTIVTVARSSEDDYCPAEDVELIQAGVLDELRQRIDSEMDVRLAYLENEEEGAH
ncbi:UPF0489 protein C5orf22 homolog [Copidosoma floridanum]|uniref:UPF0489 protein C5orf22 homolog n=1 Tax=Copidosoma floridanum TaxID=29053 RepID=UPI0006C9893E|nr:UPF0489 protein C5orf22 homolog [Copidosoma floridanum]